MTKTKILQLLILHLSIAVLCLSCDNSHEVKPYVFPELDSYGVLFLLVDSNGKNILDPNSIGPQYDYKAIEDCTAEITAPQVEGLMFTLFAPFIDKEKEVRYLLLSAGRELEEGDEKILESEFTIYSEYIFRDKAPHHIKVVHDPDIINLSTVYVDGVVCESIHDNEAYLNYYTKFVVPWD